MKFVFRVHTISARFTQTSISSPQFILTLFLCCLCCRCPWCHAVHALQETCSHLGHVSLSLSIANIPFHHHPLESRLPLAPCIALTQHLFHHCLLQPHSPLRLPIKMAGCLAVSSIFFKISFGSNTTGMGTHSEGHQDQTLVLRPWWRVHRQRLHQIPWRARHGALTHYARHTTA